MASPRANTPETNPKAYIGHSAMLTAHKPGRASPGKDPKAADRATRSQRRLPKKTYFEGNDDEDVDDVTEDVPLAASQQSFEPPKSKPAKKQAQHSNPDPLNAMIESDSDIVAKTSTRPKKQLKDQLQPETKARTSAGSKKQAAKQKPMPNKKPKQPTAQHIKEEQRSDRSSDPADDRYNIEVSSPTAPSKASKPNAKKAARAPRAAQTKRKSKGDKVVAATSNSQQDPIIVEDADESSIYEDPVELVMKTSSALNDNQRALQPLEVNQSHKAGGSSQSLVDDQRDRKPHLISFGKTGPRNQGMSENRLAQATKRRHQDSIIEDSVVAVKDNTAQNGAQTQATSFNPSSNSQSQNPGIFEGDDEVGFNPQSPPQQNATASGKGKENRFFAGVSSQENADPSVNPIGNDGFSAAIPQLNGPAFHVDGDGQDTHEQSLRDGCDRGDHNANSTAVQPPAPCQDKQGPSLHQKRGPDEMGLAPETGNARYKRAKNGESLVVAATAVVGSGSTSHVGLSRKPGDHTGEKLFKRQEPGEARRDTGFNRRLHGFWPKDEPFKRVEAQALEEPMSHSPDEQPKRNEVAQRMYQSLSNNSMTAQSRQSAGSGVDRSLRQGGTTGRRDDEASPSQAPEGRPAKEATGPYPRLAGAMEGVNHMALGHLKSKESDLNDILTDYEVNAGEIVRRIAFKHSREAQAAMRQVDSSHRNLVRLWTETRSNIHALIEAVNAVKVGDIVASIHRDSCLDRLRSIQGV